MCPSSTQRATSCPSGTTGWGYVDPATGEVLPTWDEALDAIGQFDLPWHVARFGDRLDTQGVLAGSPQARRCIGYLTKYLTKQVGDCHQVTTGPQHDHAARLAEALRHQPCSPRCANWLRWLRLGEWIDPRRDQVALSVVAVACLSSRSSVKRRTRESDEAAWRNYICPCFGNWPVASITAAEVSGWVGSLVARGLAPSTATRALATLRSILAFAVADARIQHNVAAVRRPTSGHARREGQALTLDELRALMEACQGRYRDVVPVLALAGLRWGELAGLQVGDRVSIPGPGLRLSRTVLASGGGGALYVDTLKSNRGRTVPLVLDLVPIVDRWSAGKAPGAWLGMPRHR